MSVVGKFGDPSSNFEFVKQPVRVLYRPLGGWGARAWRREVARWGAFSALVVASWACLNLLVGAVELLSH